MSTSQKTVTILTSVDSLLDIVVFAAQEAKAGKPAAQIAIDMLPKLVSGLTGLSELSKDVANKEALETTVSLKLSGLVNVFVS